MPSAKVSARSVSCYQLNNSLLFQFILSDFITVCLDMQCLEVLCHRRPLPSEEHNYHVHHQDILQQISIILDRFIGSRNEHIKRFSSSFNEGILTRLKMHCALFSQQVDTEKELLALQHYAEKTWQHCLSAVEALSEAPDKCAQLFTTLEKANNTIHRLAKLIARIVHQFRDDENVIFFVLRHKEAFDKAYGKRFIHKLFCRMYPKGLPEARHFLIKKYMDRSFDNITPVIANLFADLEAANV